MMQRLSNILVLLVLVAIILLSSPVVRGQQNNIAGLVLDKDNHPIKGITVRIYRGSQPIKEAITHQDGAYSMSFNLGSPITTIEYYGSEWTPTTITNVSGAKNHTINKVLYKIGEIASYEQGSELLLTLDRLYYISRNNNIPFDEFTKRYGAAIDATRKSSTPPSIKFELDRREYLYAKRSYNEFSIRNENTYPYYYQFYPNPSPALVESTASSSSSIDFSQRSSGLELNYSRGMSEIVIDVDRPFDEEVYTVALYAFVSPTYDRINEQPIIMQTVRQPRSDRALRLHLQRRFFNPRNKRYEIVLKANSFTLRVPLIVTIEE
jgi:hypothetical protein